MAVARAILNDPSLRQLTKLSTPPRPPLSYQRLSKSPGEMEMDRGGCPGVGGTPGPPSPPPGGLGVPSVVASRKGPGCGGGASQEAGDGGEEGGQHTLLLAPVLQRQPLGPRDQSEGGKASRAFHNDPWRLRVPASGGKKKGSWLKKNSSPPLPASSTYTNEKSAEEGGSRGCNNTRYLANWLDASWRLGPLPPLPRGGGGFGLGLCL